MNLFRYCGDDPVDGSDPLGLDESANKWWEQAGKIVLSKTGNWGNRTSPGFYQDGLTVRDAPAEGKTVPGLTDLVAHKDGSVTGKLFVDTHVLPSHKGDLVDATEQDHPNGFKKFLKELSDDVRIQMVRDKTEYTSMEKFAAARKDYVQKLFENEVATQRLWDRDKGPHDYKLPKFKQK
jgi:hypothetical protein